MLFNGKSEGIECTRGNEGLGATGKKLKSALHSGLGFRVNMLIEEDCYYRTDRIGTLFIDY